MKKILAAVLSAAMVVTSVVMPQEAAGIVKAAGGDDTSTADITSGLIAYYGFEDSLENGASETGGTAKLHGGAGDTWNAPATGESNYAEGKKGKAYSFTGDIDTKRGEGLELDVKTTKNFTISAWVNTAEKVDYQPIIFSNKDGDNYITAGTYYNNFASGGIVNYKTKWHWLDKNNASESELKDLPLNTWTHITLTFSDNGNNTATATLYYNKEILSKQVIYEHEDSDNTDSPFPAYVADDFANMPIFLGINWWNQSFRGLMDEVFIYNRALSSADVDELYSKSQTGFDVEALNITDENITLAKGKTYQLKTTFTPKFANAPEITWSSDSDSVATVNNGMVSAVGEGTATITAETKNGKKATCQVTVVGEEKPVQAVTANADKTTLNLRETAQISATYTPEDATGDTNITYSSSDENVLKVDKTSGVVTAVGAGTASVTASIGTVKSEPLSFTVNDTVSVSGTAWWDDWTPSYKIEDGDMLQFEMSDLKGGSANYNNIVAVFIPVLTDGLSKPNDVPGYKEYGIIRGDNAGLGALETGVIYDGGTDDLTTEEFVQMMQDAEGTLTIKRSGNDITYCYEILGKNGTKCTRTAKATLADAEDVYVFFTVDASSYTISKVHTWKTGEYTTETTAPTCKEKGYTTYTAKSGNKTIKTDWVAKTAEHNMSDATYTDTEGNILTKEQVDALKCTQTATVSGTCSVCGHVAEGEEITGKIHNYPANGVVSVKATPSKDGTMTYTCADCTEETKGHTKQDVINKASDITLAGTSYEYTGSAITPAVTVKDSAGTEIAASNYDVAYTNNINAGTATVKITFKGNTYEGSVEKAFTITEKAAGTIAVTGITLDQKTMELKIGESKDLKATIAPTNASDKTYTWKSSNDKIATVVNGKVTAVAEGTATITVTTTDGAKTATCNVTVKPASSTNTGDSTGNTGNTGTSLKKTTITVKKGKKKVSSVTVKRSKKVTLKVTTSSKAKLSISKLKKNQKKIASVTLKKGKLTIKGKKKGTVTITITSAKTKKYKKATKKIKIKVK